MGSLGLRRGGKESEWGPACVCLSFSSLLLKKEKYSFLECVNVGDSKLEDHTLLDPNPLRPQFPHLNNE